MKPAFVRDSRESGQSITEAAISLLLLVMLSFALLEASRMIAFKAALRIAAGEIASIAAQMEFPLERAGAWRSGVAVDAQKCTPWMQASCRLDGPHRERIEAAAESELWEQAGGSGKPGPFLKLVVTTNTTREGRKVKVDLKGCYRPLARFETGSSQPERGFAIATFDERKSERNCFGQYGNLLGGMLALFRFGATANAPVLEETKILNSSLALVNSPLPTVEGPPRPEAMSTWKWFLRRLDVRSQESPPGGMPSALGGALSL